MPLYFSTFICAVLMVASTGTYHATITAEGSSHNLYKVKLEWHEVMLQPYAVSTDGAVRVGA
jgi:hypothetical protein